jgi:hypothetical protein
VETQKRTVEVLEDRLAEKAAADASQGELAATFKKRRHRISAKRSKQSKTAGEKVAVATAAAQEATVALTALQANFAREVRELTEECERLAKENAALSPLKTRASVLQEEVNHLTEKRELLLYDMPRRVSEMGTDLCLVTQSVHLPSGKSNTLMTRIFGILADNGHIDRPERVPSNSHNHRASKIWGVIARMHAYRLIKYEKGRTTVNMLDKSDVTLIGGRIGLLGSATQTLNNVPEGTTDADLNAMSSDELARRRRTVITGASVTAGGDSNEQYRQWEETHVLLYKCNYGKDGSEEEMRKTLTGKHVVGDIGDGAADCQKTCSIRRRRQLIDVQNDIEFQSWAFERQLAWFREYYLSTCVQHNSHNLCRMFSKYCLVWVSQYVSPIMMEESKKNTSMEFVHDMGEEGTGVISATITEISRMRYEIEKLTRNSDYYLAIFVALSSWAEKKGKAMLVLILKKMPRQVGSRYCAEHEIYTFQFAMWNDLKEYLTTKAAGDFTKNLNKLEQHALRYLVENWRQDVTQAMGLLFIDFTIMVFTEVSTLDRQTEMDAFVQVLMLELNMLKDKPEVVVQRFKDGSPLVSRSLFSFLKKSAYKQTPVRAHIEALHRIPGVHEGSADNVITLLIFSFYELPTGAAHYFRQNLDDTFTVSAKADATMPLKTARLEGIFGLAPNHTTTVSNPLTIETRVMMDMNSTPLWFYEQTKGARREIVAEAEGRIDMLSEHGVKLLRVAKSAKARAEEIKFKALETQLVNRQAKSDKMGQITLIRDVDQLKREYAASGLPVLVFGPQQRAGAAGVAETRVRCVVTANVNLSSCLPKNMWMRPTLKPTVGCVAVAACAGRGVATAANSAAKSGAVFAVIAPNKATVDADLPSFAVKPSTVSIPVAVIKGSDYTIIQAAVSANPTGIVHLDNLPRTSSKYGTCTKNQEELVLDQNKKWRHVRKKDQKALLQLSGNDVPTLLANMIFAISGSAGDNLVAKPVGSVAEASAEVTEKPTVAGAVRFAKENLTNPNGAGFKRTQGLNQAKLGGLNRLRKLKEHTAEFIPAPPPTPQ